MTSLMIVESPSKAKTIGKYLAKDGIKVKACIGHITELNKKLKNEGAVDVNNGFKMHFNLNPKNKDNTKDLLRLAKECDIIYLATDPDNEGAAISWHLREIIREVNKKCQFRRVTYHEVNEKAIRKAIDSWTELDMDQVNAQFARSGIDYLFGFKVSKLVWKKVAFGLSAGRVQSPALRLLTEREVEIRNFIPLTYWSITLGTEKNNIPFTTHLSRIEGDRIDNQSITDVEYKDKHLAKLTNLVKNKEKLVVKDIKITKVSRKPKAPYITSTLQMDCVRKLAWSSDRTMQVAQSLFEGRNSDHGYITYHRTDSPVLSQEALNAIHGYAKEHYPEFTLDSPRQYSTKSKSAQEAHECIRPSDIRQSPESLKGRLKDDEYKLYEMIWQRTVASQMKNAVFDSTRITFDFSKDYSFKASGSVLIFKGYLEVYQEGKEIDGEEEDSAKLPEILGSDKLNIVTPPGLQCEEKQTKPPARYNEASLVKALEEYGIGRPSTYASIPKKLKDRNYITVEKNRISVTDLGEAVNRFVLTEFPEYVDYQYTAKMETQLDAIARGELNRVAVMSEFYNPFIKLFLKVQREIENTTKGIQIPEICPLCGKHNLKEYIGRYGRYIKCPGEDCTYTRNPNKQLLEGMKCPLCKGSIYLINTKKGKKIGLCENNKGINKDGSKKGSCNFVCSETGEVFSYQEAILAPCNKCKDSNYLCRLSKKNTPYLTCSNPYHHEKLDINLISKRTKVEQAVLLEKINSLKHNGNLGLVYGPGN